MNRDPHIPPVQVLRAQVSHTWLDHEILLLSPNEVLRRWRNGDWQRLRKEFNAHKQRARMLLERLDEFSGHLDFEGPSAEAELGPQTCLRLRDKTVHRWREHVGFDALQASYATALSDLVTALDQFEAAVFSPAVTESDVAALWASVRARALALKDLFTSGRVPREVGAP